MIRLILSVTHSIRVLKTDELEPLSFRTIHLPIEEGKMTDIQVQTTHQMRSSITLIQTKAETVAGGVETPNIVRPLRQAMDLLLQTTKLQE